MNPSLLTAIVLRLALAAGVASLLVCRDPFGFPSERPRAPLGHRGRRPSDQRAEERASDAAEQEPSTPTGRRGPRSLREAFSARRGS